MPKRKRATIRLTAVLLALGLVAAACGDDDTSSDPAGDAVPTEDSDSTASGAGEDESEDVSEPTPAEEPSTAEEPLAAPADWAGTLIEVWSVPFDSGSPRSTIAYEPTTATQEWNLCVSFPHMKDAYWLAVNYGAAEESERQGVKMTLVEAGGYTELPTQISQIEDCVQNGADAVIIGAISFDGLNNLVDEIVGDGIPVIDVINGISSPNLTAKSLVSFGEMGAHACSWVAEHVGDEPTKIAWFPGPAGAGWVEAGDAGCQGALEGTAVEIVDVKFGDTGKEAQSVLVEDALAANPDIDFIVGTAVTAEAATSILRDRGLDSDIAVVSYYFTPGVHEGLVSGRILAAPTDSPVIQARVAIDQAVRALEGLPFEKHVGPELFVVDVDGIDAFDSTSTLAPDSFSPVFSVG